MKTKASLTFPLEIKKGSTRVKIYRTVDRGRDRFTLGYHEGARRVLRQFADFAEAKKEAGIVAEKLNAGQGSALELTGKDRDAYLYALDKLKTLKMGLVPAIDEYIEAKKWDVPLATAARAYHDSHADTIVTKTVQEVIDELLATKCTDGASNAYMSDLHVKLNRFSRDFKTNISEVTTKDIDTWLRGLKLSGRSRNHFRSTIVLLFNFGKANGYLDRDRTHAAEHTSVVRKKLRPIEIYTPEDFAKLLAAADDSTLPRLVFGGFCGLRPTEAKLIQWQDVIWESKSIRISADIAKTRTRRLAPLTDAAASWLLKWKTAKGPAITGEINDRMGALCEKCGVKWKKNALRHSFITYRLAIVKDFTRVAFEAGNSPQIIRSNYDAVAQEGEARLWFSIKPKTAPNIVEMKEAA